MQVPNNALEDVADSTSVTQLLVLSSDSFH